MDIDLRTLSLVVLVAYIFEVFAVAFLYRSNKKYPGVGWWVIGTTLSAAGIAFLLLRDIIQFIFVTVILSNALIILGSVFFYTGFMRFLGKREELRLVIPPYLVFIALYCYFTYVNDDITVRTVIMSVFLAYFLFLEASALLGTKPPGITGSAHFIVAAESFMAFFLLFRAGYVLTSISVEGLFTPTMIQTLTFLLFFVNGFLLTVGLIIMVNQRLNADVTEAKEHFELFFNTSPDGVLISRMDNGVIIDANEGFLHLTGFLREEAVGHSSPDLNFWKNPDDRKAVFDEINKTGICENFETLFRRKDGSEITVIISARIITVQDIPCIISVTRNISERKLVEDALKQANRKLNLLSGITRHDILNTTMVLGGYIELALDEPAEPKLKGYLRHMDVSAKNIEHQIEFTREYQEIGVNAATWQNVGEVAEMTGSAFRTEGVTVNVECRNVEIFADPLLRKVFYNLFDNAFRYAPPFKTITISCTEIKDGEDGEGRLSVVFADDGAGITEEDRKLLFERGFGKHTGLGLFLSREILAITGITITENGEEGKGARFEMTVPKGAYRFTGDGE